MVIAETKHRATGPKVSAGCSPRGIVGSNELLGLPVIDSHKECIGTVADIMFWTSIPGQLAYGVVALSRAPQWSEHVIAIPWRAMHLDSEGEHLCVNALRDWIERAPLDAGRGDAKPAGSVNARVLVHSFFGTKPYWETGSQQHSQPPPGAGAFAPVTEGAKP